MGSMIADPGRTADPSTPLRSGRDDKQEKRRGGTHPRVGMDVSTPVRMPVGQREVTVFRRV
jgi:hypothetical protein